MMLRPRFFAVRKLSQFLKIPRNCNNGNDIFEKPPAFYDYFVPSVNNFISLSYSCVSKTIVTQCCCIDCFYEYKMKKIE